MRDKTKYFSFFIPLISYKSKAGNKIGKECKKLSNQKMVRETTLFCRSMVPGEYISTVHKDQKYQSTLSHKYFYIYV